MREVISPKAGVLTYDSVQPQNTDSQGDKHPSEPLCANLLPEQ